MGMNKQTGNMYPFITHTWNPIRGKCPHECTYCYMKRFKVGSFRFECKEMDTNLGKGNFIFVGSSTDMWADQMPSEYIERVLEHCNRYPENEYLFQTKNPDRYKYFLTKLPPKSILGTTIETNYPFNKITKAPDTIDRALAMAILKGIKKMVSIEPIMDFDLHKMVTWLKAIDPDFISIGADSKGNNLPEPSPEKIDKLVGKLGAITNDVVIKSNMDRLI